MKSQISILRRLQELVLTRDEHHQTGDGSQLDKLSDQIAELQSQLEPQVRGVYDRLYKKGHVMMAAMSNGCCAACGMQVPIAQGQQVKLGQHLVTCSSCGRILFAEESDAARNVADKGERDEPKVGIARFSGESLMIAELGECSREEAIAKLADAMEKGGFISNADSLATAAMDREGVLSTAMGEGLAFPHVRGVEGGGLTLALGVSKKGFVWDSAGERAKLVFFSVIPVAVSAFYLRLMAGLTETFSKKDNRDALLAAKSPAELWKTFMKTTRYAIR